ncbi:hypothetical protein PWEIH_04566 [Listeria weihenstephanensis FSL R9-0317]|uniref:Uncharacterized protein n=1 Tax=Listeria weihenstephanensis TaxID=1006155 RepID=A0A1S7FQU4_9LIST|nr:hypothetical protein [Listeria weihenstephanensis]AQY49821.1 hypothetical protein UE46_01260 [Listeria weihenstephanensis]EUJ40325.1 hypothetical protein PWEIH_04566 [Listeria weihenstephanensis FSL R9-0317]
MKKWITAVVGIIFVGCLVLFSDRTKADDETTKLNIGVLGSYALDPKLFEMHRIEENGLSSRNFDAILVTKDYINDADQESLKAQLRAVKLPILFADFGDKSSLAFMNTELHLADIEMLGKAEIQMFYVAPNGEHATYGIFETDEVSVKQLNQAVELVPRVKNLKEWEVEMASMAVE